jgi:hypothetical protein
VSWTRYAAPSTSSGIIERYGEVEPEKRIELRISINVGDIIVEGDRLGLQRLDEDLFWRARKMGIKHEAMAVRLSPTITSNKYAP